MTLRLALGIKWRYIPTVIWMLGWPSCSLTKTGHYIKFSGPLCSQPYIPLKSIDLPTPYMLPKVNLYRGHPLQEGIVEAVCLASRMFRLTPLEEYDPSEPSG